MSIATLEHINLTVSDPKKTAANLCALFDWHIRWEGASMDNGYTVHVGSDNQYLALYATGSPKKSQEENYKTVNGLNHIAVVVDDLDAMKTRVENAGFTPYNFGHYEPGHRFYFNDQDGIEFEIVSYAPQEQPFYEDYIAK